MDGQTLGVVTDTEYIVLTPGEKPVPDWQKWLLYGALGLGALLFLTRKQTVVVMKG